MENTLREFVSRRDFMKVAGGTALSALAASATVSAAQTRAAGSPLYKISLAEWSINRPLFDGKMQHLDFAKIAKSVGIEAIEYVNQFFKDKAKDTAFLTEMNTRAKGEGVTQVLIMCDGEGNLGDPDAAKRQTAVENHYKWVDAAKFLGCHTIRVNGYSSGTPDEQMKLVADGMHAAGLRQLPDQRSYSRQSQRESRELRLVRRRRRDDANGQRRQRQAARLGFQWQ
jgi:L-ribulose-5-phosphate 3-epimerase